MADLSVTAGSVLPGAGAVTEDGVAGAAVTAGQAVYRDIDQSYKLADADGASALIRTPRGLALNTAGIGQPLRIQKSGEITIGATVVANTQYYLSSNPGGLCPLADVGTGEYMSTIGVAKSTTVIVLNIASTGVAN